MKGAAERGWVRVLDSSTWRRLTRSARVSRILKSSTFTTLDTSRRYALTRLRSLRHPGVFSQVETCLLTLGHVKSGGSLLGALLDAHPDAAIADEVDVARYVHAKFNRDQIFHLLVKGARREAMKGRVTARRLTPYSLAVPDQWQGRTRSIRVVGETRGGPTTRRLGQDPDLLHRLQALMEGVELRFVHVIRDPFDPVAAMVLRGGKPLDRAVEEYARRAEMLVDLRARIDPGRLLTVSYEELTADPVARLGEVCRFAGLELRPDHLEACRRVVDPRRSPEREGIEWDRQAVLALREVIARTGFLSRYDQPARGRTWPG